MTAEEEAAEADMTPANKVRVSIKETLQRSPAKVAGDFLRGSKLALPNGWGDAEVIGAYRSSVSLYLMLAWPNAEKTTNLFSEKIEALTYDGSGS